MPAKVFVSHSSKDEEIANALIALLRVSLNLKSGDIVCTSVSGYKLGVGEDIESALKRNVIEAKACIGIITPISVESAYVLFELGARWGAELFIAPLLAAGATPSLLRGPLSQTHALSCDKRQDLHQLVANLAKQLQIRAEGAHVYEREIELLLNANAKKQEQSLSKPDTQIVREKRIKPAADAVISDEKISPIPVTSVVAIIEREAAKLVRSELVEVCLSQASETSGKLVLRVPILANYEMLLLEFRTKSVLNDFPLNLTEYLSGNDKAVVEIESESELVAELQNVFRSDGARSKITNILQRAKGKLLASE